ncbi:MAG: hypothetical protein FJ194_03285 [Gammaproteobacteria bacterium]|nr:hypothetical protein [Gammaproteobacteria bacterium]
MTWHPGQDAASATLLQVAFDVIDASHTRLTLTHDGWEARGEQGPQIRNNYEGGWVEVLKGFVEALQRC